MPAPLLAYAVPAAASLIGGLFGNRSANRNQRQANQLQREGLDFARQNYSDRNPFRQASFDALNDGGKDWSGLYDPSLYESEDVPYTESARRTGARTSARSAFDKTQNIDRTGNIRAALRDFDTESEPIFEANSRRIGQRASQFGALGKGTINTELGELGARIARDRSLLQNDLIRDSEERNVDDAFRSLDATRQEEMIGREDDDAAYGRAIGERERRTTLGRQGMLDQLMLGEQNRAERGAATQRAATFGGLGFGNDPSNAMFQGAGYFGNQAANAGQAAGMNFSVLGDLLSSYLNRNRGQRAPAQRGTTASGYDPREWG